MTMYRLTPDPNTLLHVETNSWIPRGHYQWPTKWLLENEPEPIPLPYLPGTPEHHRAISEEAWRWMTSVVKERRYDSIESCCSYSSSSVPRYKAEALAMIAWRDAINQKLEQLVVNPPPYVVTWEQVKPLLPQPEAFSWPDKVELPLDIEEPSVQIGR